MLKKELDCIKDTFIKRFTEEALSHADPEFWKVPASNSGKYHPPEDNGAGGLVRHIQKAVVVVQQFGIRANFSDYESDLAISATLLHDINKNGNPWTENTDYTHGLIAYHWLDQFELEDPTAKQTIRDAVRYHMAPWNYVHVPWSKENFTRAELEENHQEIVRALLHPSRIELAVREADYWSTRNVMSFMPGHTIVCDSRIHDSPEEWIQSLIKLNDTINRTD